MGRKKVVDESVRVTLSLDPSAVDVFTELGEGNLSKGARLTAQLVKGKKSSSRPVVAPARTTVSCEELRKRWYRDNGYEYVDADTVRDLKENVRLSLSGLRKWRERCPHKCQE